MPGVKYVNDTSFCWLKMSVDPDEAESTKLELPSRVMGLCQAQSNGIIAADRPFSAAVTMLAGGDRDAVEHQAPLAGEMDPEA